MVFEPRHEALDSELSLGIRGRLAVDQLGPRGVIKDKIERNALVVFPLKAVQDGDLETGARVSVGIEHAPGHTAERLQSDHQCTRLITTNGVELGEPFLRMKEKQKAWPFGIHPGRERGCWQLGFPKTKDLRGCSQAGSERSRQRLAVRIDHRSSEDSARLQDEVAGRGLWIIPRRVNWHDRVVNIQNSISTELDAIKVRCDIADSVIRRSPE